MALSGHTIPLRMFGPLRKDAFIADQSGLGNEVYFNSTYFFGISLTFGQGYESIDYLYSKSDEILVVKVLGEKTASESYMTCRSYVTAEVAQQLKITRLNADTKNVQFVRILGCAKGSIFPHERILDKGKRFIVFLSSANPGYDNLRNASEYSLTDYILGLQPYTEDLFEYLQIKQREKR